MMASNGNPTTYKGQTLTYDAENRLTGYGSVMTAGYNGDNKRAWKRTSAGKTFFLYNGDLLVCELNSGTITATNTIAHKTIELGLDHNDR